MVARVLGSEVVGFKILILDVRSGVHFGLWVWTRLHGLSYGIMYLYHYTPASRGIGVLGY